ncbi:MAG TPA: sulfatase/phosphatase domain-containing protein [Bryobacteraceae bacterium]|nr:sulfatase/phosphatase domain-containing protein [Bryobacteraceae bacterium]
MRRREFLLTPFALVGQTQPPADVLARCMTFPRAYACCPQPALARRALESGKFPHALAPGDPRTISLDALNLVLPGRIAVFTSPAGDGMDSPFEKSVKVPLAIYAPGLLAPRIAEEILISTVDLAPTLLGLRGERVPGELQGRDLSGLLLGRTHEPPDSVYIEGGIGTGGEWRAVIRGYDKLVMDLNGEVTHLFNLAEDPEEKTNLAQASSSQVTRDALAALIQAWKRRISDGYDPSGLKRR